MVVENDTPNLGRMQFYEVPIESETKLLGPTSVREALDRDPDFAQLKTLLRNPRIGDNILYQVGEHDTYFIPVYTAGAGGVVAQLGTIAAVGAAFTGEYYVGLGDTQESAFEAYLQKLSGVTTGTSITTVGGVVLDKSGRVDTIMSIFEESNIRVTTPTSIQIPLSFSVGDIAFYSQSDMESTTQLIRQLINEAGVGNRILMWEEGNTLNFGYLKVVDNVSELHYISIEVGK